MTWSSRLAHTRCVCFCRCSMLLVLEYTLNSIQLQRENVSLKSDQKCSQAISYDDGRVLLFAAILFILRISFCFPISPVYGAHKAKSRAREGVAFFAEKNHTVQQEGSCCCRQRKNTLMAATFSRRGWVALPRCCCCCDSFFSLRDSLCVLSTVEKDLWSMQRPANFSSVARPF